jgi:hypothetical protein
MKIYFQAGGKKHRLFIPKVHPNWEFTFTSIIHNELPFWNFPLFLINPKFVPLLYIPFFVVNTSVEKKKKKINQNLKGKKISKFQNSPQKHQIKIYHEYFCGKKINHKNSFLKGKI